MEREDGLPEDLNEVEDDTAEVEDTEELEGREQNG